MKKFTKLNIIHISLMIFGFFFGAGNLMFPIYLGMQSGSNMNIAIIFFAISEIGFTMLGIIAASKVNSLENIKKKMGIFFSTLLLTSICIALGPGIAIPRAATMPFDMSIIEYIPASINENLARAIFTAIFLLVAYYFTRGQDNLLTRLGKILTPITLLTMLVVLIGVVTKVDNVVLSPTGDYITNPAYKGFVEGYNTMDSLASLNIGVMTYLILSHLYDENKETIVKYIKYGCAGASILFFIVYYSLAYIGRRMAYIYPDSENGAILLKNTIKHFYGDTGVALITVLFILACLSATISIVSFSNTYISKRFNIDYNRCSIIILFASFIVSTLGLSKILLYSVHFLLFIYPIFFTIILLEFLKNIYCDDKFVYRSTVWFVTLISISNSILKFLKYEHINWITPTFVLFIILLIYRRYFYKEN